MNKLLFIFLDGVGLGLNSEINPIKNLFKNLTGVDFVLNNYPIINDDFLLKPIDAVLGINGIPQSATGQTSIMTGVNSQRRLGFHHTAFPNRELINIIKEKNILLELKNRGLSVTCANMYSKEYFEKRESRSKNMLPVSALSVKTSNLPFRFMDDYNKNEAVFADITNEIIRSRGYNIDIITPQIAGSNMLNICNKNDFTFFEYFITDTYGHKKEELKLISETQKLNSFIEYIWNSGQNGVDIILTSDHGNCEDISTGNHTKNPVPFLYLSKDSSLKGKFFREVENITHFKGAILNRFGF
ncbi:hypothetical protein EW093_02925 [Thiospirochaeta perfilievii]|uniref:Metalloenzyme domain-containing protein n=1 Tax=Thiospirochaeta perfilievii TaxID=252967 RepID=A0A5C1Q6S5_9SPIO|nr:hypothetical protein [Thiospirochaeta perfilievii]QEN03695.1 hypothetical protein EW093_02925 [Thiospirochaeta perfilievii]